MIRMATKAGAAGGGGGGCYEDFRRIAPEDLAQRVEKSHMQVNLLEDLKRAEYTWSYTTRAITKTPETNWFFIVPFSQERISQIWARDNDGGLEWRQDVEGDDNTRITIAYRDPVEEGNNYSFTFGYTTDVISTVSPGILFTTVAYTDWCSHNNPCDKIIVSVDLPKESKALSAVPPADLSHNPIMFEVNGRRPNEYFSYLLSYRKKKLTRAFWIWLATTIISGGVGAGISIALS